MNTCFTADALITATPGLACCVLTADCLPVLLAAADGSEVGIAHAGWRGMANGIIANTVRGMSASAGQLVAWLGPAIGPCHFEVGPEVKEEFQQSWANSIAADAIADADIVICQAGCEVSVMMMDHTVRVY